jgi:hypothetical protein
VREAGSGGDCRLQRRMTTRLQDAEPVYTLHSLPRAAACAAPQLRSVLHASPVFLDTVPAKFRVSDDIGAASPPLTEFMRPGGEKGDCVLLHR